MPQQQDDVMMEYKRNFNVVYTICRAHQMGVVIPLRKGFGTDVLRTPCVLAFVLICVWAMCTRDNFMGLWAAVWLCCYTRRRFEAAALSRSGAKLHSQYDGWPDAIRIGRTEKIAKLIVEPLVVLGFGATMFCLYQRNGWQLYGLPYFMLAGGFTLPFVEMIKQMIWQRRTQSIVNARVEQEGLMNEFRNRYGN
jgi:hypothetical protein